MSSEPELRPTDAGTRATVERMLGDLVATWKQRASSERIDEQASSAAPEQSSYWAGRADATMDAATDLEHVAEALAAQPSGLAERLRELADEICEAGDLKLPAVYIAGRLRALLAQEDR